MIENLGITTPRFNIGNHCWPHIESLDLADPSFGRPGNVDILLGADVYARLLREGLQKGPHGAPTAQRTALGWIVFGAVAAPPGNNSVVLTTRVEEQDSLHDLLRGFWELEEVERQRDLSPEDLECEKHFVEGCRRDETGRYMIRLPLKQEPSNKLQETLSIARCSLRRTQGRMRKNEEFAKEYQHFMREFEDLEHTRQLINDGTDMQNHRMAYLPHHGIWQSSDRDKKLRVVFDASCKVSSGLSLNDMLHTEPTLQTDLITIFLRWRIHRFVIVADIEKMFRQIRVDARDVDLQRILWEDPITGSERHYRLQTLTYGLRCASYVAIRVLLQLAKDEGWRYPHAARALERSTYVDDIYEGADNLDSARTLRDELSKLLSSGGFPLKKWVSNHRSLTDDLPQSDRLRPHWRDFCSNQPVKTLGIAWDPVEDEFRYRLPDLPKLESPSKRSTLSVIARLFDPLGWLSPVIVTAKILVQDMWRCKLAWDDKLPSDLYVRWLKFAKKLPAITLLRLPRWLGTLASSRFDLHGFADASQTAYAAVVYLRTTDISGPPTTRLIIAKTRVAPVKMQTVPRLELCAATLLAKLLHRVMTEYKDQVNKVHAWSDSTITLAWLKGDPTRWPIFVANRVAQVHRSLPGVQWKHVPSEDNPADQASRGIDVEVLVSESQWWHGPSWLTQTEEKWPQQLSCFHVQRQPNPDRDVYVGLPPVEDDFTIRFSSLELLIRVVARCLRLVHLRTPEGKDRLKTPLAASELSRAYIECIRYVQRRYFEVEISALRRALGVSKTSSLYNLSPFMDTSGTIRVGGRIHQAALPYNQRHPAILPKGCHLSRLIIDRAHRAAMHGGNALTYAYAIRDTWIVGGRAQVRAYIRKCIVCARNRARPSVQQMGDLPMARVTLSRPFAQTGLDYAGSFQLKAAKRRGVLTTKGYLAVFVCLATKAVHLEVVGDLSTATFLAALRRFISRRGSPAEIWSDNATTFHGADAELRSMLREAEVDWRLVTGTLARSDVAIHSIRHSTLWWIVGSRR